MTGERRKCRKPGETADTDPDQQQCGSRRGVGDMGPELARTVVNAGWDLNEMRSVGLSLEDIFLQLTSAEQKEKEKEKS